MTTFKLTLVLFVLLLMGSLMAVCIEDKTKTKIKAQIQSDHEQEIALVKSITQNLEATSDFVSGQPRACEVNALPCAKVFNDICSSLALDTSSAKTETETEKDDKNLGRITKNAKISILKFIEQNPNLLIQDGKKKEKEKEKEYINSMFIGIPTGPSRGEFNKEYGCNQGYSVTNSNAMLAHYDVVYNRVTPCKGLLSANDDVKKWTLASAMLLSLDKPAHEFRESLDKSPVINEMRSFIDPSIDPSSKVINCDNWKNFYDRFHSKKDNLCSIPSTPGAGDKGDGQNEEQAKINEQIKQEITEASKYCHCNLVEYLKEDPRWKGKGENLFFNPIYLLGVGSYCMSNDKDSMKNKKANEIKQEVEEIYTQCAKSYYYGNIQTKNKTAPTMISNKETGKLAILFKQLLNSAKEEKREVLARNILSTFCHANEANKTEFVNSFMIHESAKDCVQDFLKCRVSN